VIEQTKDKLNAISEDQREAIAELDWFRQALPGVANADGINALISRAKAAGKPASGLLLARATELGFTFDKAAGAFAAPVSEDAA
jgi:hypothetical protein